MATISITGNIFSGCVIGQGSFAEIGDAFSKARESAGNLSAAIGKLKTKIDIASIGTNIETSQEMVQTVQKCEENKKGALSNAYQKLEKLIQNVGSVDFKVAGKIRERKLDFYARYNYLEPDIERERREKKEEEEKGFWEKVGDVCSGVAEVVGEFVSGAIEGIKEHWKEIVIGLAIIVVGAVITVLTGGAALPFILGALKVAAIVGLAVGAGSSIASGVACAISGGNASDIAHAMGKGFGSGFAVGFEVGAAIYTGQAMGKIISGLGNGAKIIAGVKKVASVTNIMSNTFDIIDFSMSALNFFIPNCTPVQLWNDGDSWLGKGKEFVGNILNTANILTESTGTSYDTVLKNTKTIFTAQEFKYSEQTKTIFYGSDKGLIPETVTEIKLEVSSIKIDVVSVDAISETLKKEMKNIVLKEGVNATLDNVSNTTKENTINENNAQGVDAITKDIKIIIDLVGELK